MKNHTLQLGIIMMAASIIIFWRITTNSQHKKDIEQAVLQSQINQLNQDNAYLLADTMYLHSENKALQATNAANQIKLSQYAAKYAQKAAELQTELSKLKRESDTNAVRRFLDETGYNMIPVIKYDSLYLTPANATKKSNIERAELYNQISVNGILRNESEVKSIMIKDLNTENSNKDKEIKKLGSVNNNLVDVNGKLNEVAKAEHKKYRAQKVKTWIVGGVGAAIITGVVILK